MNGNCCDDDDDDGETSWRLFLRTPVIWMTGIRRSQKDKWAVWKQSSLFIIIIIYVPLFHFFKSFWNELQLFCKYNVEYRCYWFNSGTNFH